MDFTADKTPDRRVTDRFPLNVQIELRIAADSVTAESLDMSESGLRFETAAPIPVVLRMKLKGLDIERHATVAWIKKTASGKQQYGLEFLDPSGDDVVASETDS